MKKQSNSRNSLFVGKPGKGTKTHIFKENDFKPNLVPHGAKVKHVKVDGNNLVVMSY